MSQDLNLHSFAESSSLAAVEALDARQDHAIDSLPPL